MSLLNSFATKSFLRTAFVLDELELRVFVLPETQDVSFTAAQTTAAHNTDLGQYKLVFIGVVNFVCLTPSPRYYVVSLI